MWMVILVLLLWPENTAVRHPSVTEHSDSLTADAPARRIGRYPSGFL